MPKPIKKYVRKHRKRISIAFPLLATRLKRYADYVFSGKVESLVSLRSNTFLHVSDPANGIFGRNPIAAKTSKIAEKVRLDIDAHGATIEALLRERKLQSSNAKFGIALTNLTTTELNVNEDDAAAEGKVVKTKAKPLKPKKIKLTGGAPEEADQKPATSVKHEAPSSGDEDGDGDSVDNITPVLKVRSPGKYKALGGIWVDKLAGPDCKLCNSPASCYKCKECGHAIVCRPCKPLWMKIKNLQKGWEEGSFNYCPICKEQFSDFEVSCHTVLRQSYL